MGYHPDVTTNALALRGLFVSMEDSNMSNVLNPLSEPSPAERERYQTRKGEFNYSLFVRDVMAAMKVGEICQPTGLYRHSQRYGNTDNRDAAEPKLRWYCNQSQAGWRRRKLSDVKGYCFEKTEHFPWEGN